MFLFIIVHCEDACSISAVLVTISLCFVRSCQVRRFCLQGHPPVSHRSEVKPYQVLHKMFMTVT